MDDDPYQALIPKQGPAAIAPAPAPAASGDNPYQALTPKTPPSTIAEGPPPSPDATGNSVWYDMWHPRDADLSRPQTWRDWATRTYHPTLKDAGSAALDDASFGTADIAQSALTGEDVDAIRKRTAASQTALGPMGPVLSAATYAVPGLGEAKAVYAPTRALGILAKETRPYVGRYGAAAVEGGAANAASSVGHQAGGDNPIDWAKVGRDTATGTVAGVTGQAVGNLTKGAKPPDAFDNLRAKSAAGHDIGPDLKDAMSKINQAAPSGQSSMEGLQKAYDISQASTDPGWKAKTAANAAAVGAWFKTGGGFWNPVPGIAKNAVLDTAQVLNARARNKAVQGQFDSMLQNAGRPNPGQDWADAVQRLSIGSQLP